MLDFADHLASVASAVFGLVGLVLTIVGMRAQGKAKAGHPSDPSSDPRPSGLPPPETPEHAHDPHPTAPADTRQFYIPPRGEWVPSSDHLPPGPPAGYGYAPDQPRAPEQAGQHWTPRSPASPLRSWLGRRSLVQWGIALIAVALLLAGVAMLGA